MTTHLVIDDALINEAFTLGHFETKEDTVITALREFINHRKQRTMTSSDDDTVQLSNFQRFLLDSPEMSNEEYLTIEEKRRHLQHLLESQDWNWLLMRASCK